MKKLFIKLVRSRFITWVSHSLIGHMALLGMLFLILWYPVMAVTIYSEGDFTVSWALHAAVISVLAGVVSGILMWFIITRPLIKWKKQVERAKTSKHRESGGGQ